MSERGSNPLWGGRFGASPAEAFERLNASIPFDVRLAPYDIQGSIAHARMLGERGIITVKEVEDLVRGLRSVLEEVGSGRFSWALSDEDVHTAIERRLRELVGDVALKLHTGRSRNDQVALDLRLFVRDAAERIRAALLAAMRALVEVGGVQRLGIARIYAPPAGAADSALPPTAGTFLGVREGPETSRSGRWGGERLSSRRRGPRRNTAPRGPRAHGGDSRHGAARELARRRLRERFCPGSPLRLHRARGASL